MQKKNKIFGNLKIFKKFSNNKKSIDLTMNTIIVMMILLIVAAVIIYVFVKYYGQETGILGEKIEGLKGGDCDSDGAINIIDPCPCDKDIKENCPTKAEDCNTKIKNKQC